MIWVLLGVCIIGIISLLALADRICMDRMRHEWDEWNG